MTATLGDRLTLQVTDATALAANTFSHVMESMATSYALALVLTLPLMMLMLGSVRQGLLAMVPSGLPIIVGLGYMGWTGIRLNLPTLLCGGIIIGLRWTTPSTS